MPVTYRVGLIGCGRMGATIDDEVKDRPNAHVFLPYSHAAAIVASERTELVAVCDPVPEKAEAIGQRYGAQKAYSDHEAMIDAENLDMVAVATRPGPHAAIVRYAAERGVRGIYCEKPLCNAVSEMDVMLEACRRAGVQFNYGTQRRYMPVYSRVREMVAEGAIGDVQSIVAHCGVSAAQWGLTHAADMVLFLAGDGEAEFVQGTLVAEESDWEGHVLKKDAAISSAYIRFKNGIHANLVASGGWEFEVSGSKGKIRTLSNSLDYQLRQADEQGVGILGLGELGKACAEALVQLGFDVAGWSRTPKEIPGVTCFEGRGGLDPLLGQAETRHHLHGDLRHRHPRRLGDKRHRSRCTRVGLDDVHRGAHHRELHIDQSAHIEPCGDCGGVGTDHLHDPVRQGLRGNRTGRIAAVHTGFFDVFHHPTDEYLSGVIPDGIDVDLDGAGEEPVDEHRSLGRESPLAPEAPGARNSSLLWLRLSGDSSGFRCGPLNAAAWMPAGSL